jgi:hypothetical protein
VDLSIVLETVTLIAVISGILFGLIQLRHYHLSRKREATLMLLNSFRTRDFYQGLSVLQEMEIGLSKEEIEERANEALSSLLLVTGTWESIGILVFNREISIDIVSRAYRSQIILSWMKLENYVSELRTVLQRDDQYEWFQWLAERMISIETADSSIPAYTAYRDWE